MNQVYVVEKEIIFGSGESLRMIDSIWATRELAQQCLEQRRARAEREDMRRARVMLDVQRVSHRAFRYPLNPGGVHLHTLKGRERIQIGGVELFGFDEYGSWFGLEADRKSDDGFYRFLTSGPMMEDGSLPTYDDLGVCDTTGFDDGDWTKEAHDSLRAMLIAWAEEVI